MKKYTKQIVILSFLLTVYGFQSFAQLPDTWSQKADFGGSARYAEVSFSIGTKGYLGTGYGIGMRKDFWEYDPTTDTWSQKVDFEGTARYSAIGFSIGTKGYIGTGYDGVLRNDFWEYDPIANTWTQKADFAGPARKGAVGFSIGTKGYIGTGHIDSTTRVNDFWEYDPGTDAWTQKSNIGITSRSYAVGFSIGSKGYIGTGNSGGSLDNDFWEYNPDIDTWIAKANFGGSGRFGAIGCSNEVRGYIGLGDIGGGYSNDFWEYNPTVDTWTQKDNFGGQIRTLSTGFCIDNKIYVGTGYDHVNGIKYNDFWEFTISCITPIITLEPIGQSITYGASSSFTVTATDAVSYQWQVDTGSGFADISAGGIYSNVTTSTLTISIPTVAMSGYKYRCILTGNCLPSVTTDGNASLTVAPMPVVVTPDAGQTKIYSSADPLLFSYTFTPALIGTDVISGLMDRVAGENVGEYAFTPGTLTAGTNYSLTVAATPTFSITPIALTITAEDKEKCYDGTVYSGTYSVTYNGFVNTEDEGVLGGTLVFGGTSATGILAGNYSIDPSGLTSGNYTIAYASGTLVIKATPDAAIITRSGDSIISSVASGNQWYQDGVEITGSTGDVYVATSNGTYYSVVTENGCNSVPSNSIAVVDVSIREVSSELFDIYPNPGNGVFNIKLKTASKALYNIEIYNSLGALIWKQNDAIIDGNTIKTIDLNSPKSGLYTVVLRNKANSFVKKVFVTK